MSPGPATAGPSDLPPEPAIAHHYLLVPIVEVLMILALAWLGAHFR